MIKKIYGDDTKLREYREEDGIYRLSECDAYAVETNVRLPEEVKYSTLVGVVQRK